MIKTQFSQREVVCKLAVVADGSFWGGLVILAVSPWLSPMPVAACKLRHSFVKLEKTVQLAGVESKCYSTEPVLRCTKGCSATKTTPVTVGFHCLPAGKSTEILLHRSWAKVQIDCDLTQLFHLKNMNKITIGRHGHTALLAEALSLCY